MVSSSFDPGRHAVFATLFVAALAGRVVCVAALGVTLYLWWRQTLPAQLGAMALGEGLWWLAAYGLTALTEALGWADRTAWLLAWTSALAAAPWALAALAAGWGRRFAR
jgi:hypothetical protein